MTVADTQRKDGFFIPGKINEDDIHNHYYVGMKDGKPQWSKDFEKAMLYDSESLAKEESVRLGGVVATDHVII